MELFRILIEENSILICIIAFLFLRVKKEIHKNAELIIKNALLLVIIMLLADIGENTFMGNRSPIALMIVPLSNFLMYFSQQLLIICMGAYLCTVIHDFDSEADNRWLMWVFLTQGSCIAGILISIFVKFFFFIDGENIYHRGPYFVVCIILSVLGMAIECMKVIQYRDKLKKGEIIGIASYVTFPAIGLILQFKFQNFCYINLGATIVVLIIISLYEYRNYHIEKEKDRILAQSRAYLLNSQIKPHFLFNSLNVIQSLVEYEPETAKKAISHLSKYLRKNLDLKVSEKPVSIWEELDFTQNYLYMEKLRFGDKINIRYEVDDEVHFDIPLLSIQTIVENAVRHGIRKKMEGGTVLIRIYEEENVYKIQIIDDGIGFDPTAQPDPEIKKKDSNGVGIQNVKERLKLLCNGHLTIESEPGVGTRATIVIPKG